MADALSSIQGVLNDWKVLSSTQSSPPSAPGGSSQLTSSHLPPQVFVIQTQPTQPPSAPKSPPSGQDSWVQTARKIAPYAACGLAGLYIGYALGYRAIAHRAENLCYWHGSSGLANRLIQQQPPLTTMATQISDTVSSATWYASWAPTAIVTSYVASAIGGCASFVLTGYSILYPKVAAPKGS